MQCPINDVVIHANLSFSKVDEVVSHIVMGARSRIYETKALEDEISKLSDKYEGLIYDPEMRELLVHVESTGRAFVIRVKQGYPSTLGWQGSLEVVGVEPALQGHSEVELWQDKVISDRISSLSDLIPLLE